MQTISLGVSSLKSSRLAYGCWRVAGAWDPSQVTPESRETGVRAVGAAMGRNPIPIIVPCHRVVGSTGALVGYAGGLDVKRKLLAIEGADVARRS